VKTEESANRPRKRDVSYVTLVAILVGSAALAVILFLVPIFKYPKWPEIADSEVLYQECYRLPLTSQTLNGEIAPAMWPESVRRLNPRRVMIARDGYVEKYVAEHPQAVRPVRGERMIFALPMKS
jgi:hypothetical protein